MQRFLRILLSFLIAVAGIVTTVASDGNLPSFGGLPSAGGGGRNPGPTTVRRVRVAMDGAGNATCVMLEGADVTAEFFDGDAGAWSGPATVAMDEDGAEQIAVVMHGAQEATAAWEVDDEVRATQFTSGGGWSAPEKIAEGGPQRRFVDLATNPFGPSNAVFGIWTELYQPNVFTNYWGVVATRKLPGAAWPATPSRIDTNPTQTGEKPQSIFGHRVAMDGSGRGIVVWAQVAFDDTGIVNAVFARRWNGQQWDPPIRLDKNSQDGDEVREPFVGMDNEGNGHVVYVVGRTVFARRFDVTLLGWNTPVAIGPDQAATVRSLRVAVNGDGHAVATWTTASGGIYASRYAPGGGWSPFQRVDLALSGEMLATSSSVRDVCPAIDGEGFIRVLWEESGRIGTVVYDARDRSWLFAEELGLGSRPDLAMDASGRAVAAWLTGEGHVKRVWDQTVAPRGPGRIAFASYRDGDFEIYTMNADGFDVQQHTFRDASDRDPSFSPDGTEIVFESDADSAFAGFTDLYIVEVATNAVRRLTNFSSDFGSASDPAWSPDGTEVAFIGDGEIRGVFVYTIASNSFRQLSDLRGAEAPAWSPNGRWIAFSAQGDIAVVPADASAFATLVENRANEDRWPTWRDDDTLLFTATGPNEQGLQLLDLPTGVLTPLSTGAFDATPDYAPDGGAIVYSGSSDEGPRIYRIPAAGGTPFEIPGQEGGNTEPDWHAPE